MMWNKIHVWIYISMERSRAETTVRWPLSCQVAPHKKTFMSLLAIYPLQRRITLENHCQLIQTTIASRNVTWNCKKEAIYQIWAEYEDGHGFISNRQKYDGNTLRGPMCQCFSFLLRKTNITFFMPMMRESILTVAESSFTGAHAPVLINCVPIKPYMRILTSWESRIILLAHPCSLTA